jgi:tetratricopeptide (TPR) repeat protein
MGNTHDQIVERLSEYIDGELGVRAHAEVERHLAGCGDCRAVAAELRAVAARAASLVDTAPRQDLWDGVAARITGHGWGTPFHLKARRRFSFTLPQLAAASLALMVLSGGMVWLARSGDPRVDFPGTMGAELPAVAPVRLTDTHYEGAVEDLEETLARGRAQLDAETVRVLEQNLKSIDAAIAQCRQALEKDPANAYLNSHLAAARQSKLALLRRATALTAGS